MNHNDDVRACGECEPVTSLLVRAVAAVLQVHLHLHVWQSARDCHRLIVTSVVYYDDEIDNPMRHDFIVRLAQRTRGVICRHHHHNFLAV